MSGMRPLGLEGSSCKTRTGAMAGMNLGASGLGESEGFTGSTGLGTMGAVEATSEPETCADAGAKAENSSAEMTPLSRSKASNRSCCEAGLVRARAWASSGVMTPLATSTWIKGSALGRDESAARAEKGKRKKLRRTRGTNTRRAIQNLHGWLRMRTGGRFGGRNVE